MKILFASLALLPILNIQAQGFYIGAKAGYGFSLVGNEIGTTDENNYNYYPISPTAFYDNSKSTHIQRTIHGSYGEGFTPSLQVGYMFSKYLGVEVNFSYLFGRKFETKSNNNHYDYNNSDILESQIIRNNSTKTGVMSFYLNPAFVFRVPTESKIVPYAKLGMSIGLINDYKSDEIFSRNLTYSPSFYQNNTGYISAYNTNGIGTGNATGKVNIGFTASCGVDYMLTKNLALFGEVNIISSNLILKNYDENYSSTTTYQNSSNINTESYKVRP